MFTNLSLIYLRGSDDVNTHLHVGAWFIALVLVFVVVLLNKQQKDRGAKIVQMILRLFYIVILISGVQLLWNYFHGSDYLVLALVKSFAGLWVISAMEMLSIRSSKGQSTKSSWVQLVIAFALAIVLGYGVLS